MTLRRLGLDAGVVAVLGVLTAAYSMGTAVHWSYLAPSGPIVEKLGGAPVVHTGLAQWWAATAIGVGAMLVRSWLPLAALTGAVAMSLAHLVSPVVPFLPIDLAAPIALYTVASTSNRRFVSYGALAGTVAIAFTPAVVPVTPVTGQWGGLLLPPAAVASAWLFGDRARTRRAYLVEVTRRASDLERERDQQAQLAVAAERARIARELHDAVAHGLSIIVIQAQAATGALERRPARARSALATIVATGRDSLAETRRLLGLTRPDGPQLAPLPGLTDLPGLVERVESAGLAVRLEVTGDPTCLPTGVDLSAYRILQEALTNALRHAGPGTGVTITLHIGTSLVDLTVTDTGPGAGGIPDERRGNGLRGMRERVAMLGGTLSVGDEPDGGFRVRARLPIPDAT
jgi:signal transduction histidine kinase